ncbi:hypothetical protein [Elizabethkingia meningoseptica]|uniref:hypothetical protein n=1 Tax=Elizabethkingia meningoseptica TaxID=238 RepID=UPI0023AF6648|nr:hypothetical protein [Elizabethkingia meningoseptica]MDE5490796.1 hypothetical protein [Elizabethkingia meningoseptica]
MKEKLLFIVSSFIILLFLFQLSACKNEIDEISQKVQSDPLSYIRKQYVKDKNMLSGKDIKWAAARLYRDRDSIVFITVPIKNNNGNVIEALSFRIDQGKVSGHLWKYESESTFSSEDYKLTGHQIMDKMTGKVSYTSLEGTFRYSIKMIAGKSIQDMRMSSIDNVMALGDNRCSGKCHQDIEGVEIPGRPKPDPNRDPNPYPDKSPVPPAIMPGTSPNDPQQSTPCGRASAPRVKAMNLLVDKDVKREIVDKMNVLKNGKNETSRSIGKIGNTYTFSELKEGSSHNTEVVPPPGEYVAHAHTHTGLGDQGGAPHSGTDLYSTLENIAKAYSFQGSFVFASNGKTYAIGVNDRNAVIEFLKKYPRNENLEGRDINENKDFGQNYNEVYNCFMSGKCPSNGETQQDIAMETGLAFVMDKYNMGVSLLKMDTDGVLKGVTAKKEQVYDPVNKKYKDGYTKGKCQ